MKFKGILIEEGCRQAQPPFWMSHMNPADALHSEPLGKGFNEVECYELILARLIERGPDDSQSERTVACPPEPGPGGGHKESHPPSPDPAGDGAGQPAP